MATRCNTARDELRTLIPLGETIYGVVRHVSKSGMSRVIDFYLIRDGHPVNITGMIAEATDYKRSKRYHGLTVHGCGVNMLFAVVYNLGRMLYPEGFTPLAGYSRNGECQAHEPNGGYAFQYSQL